VEEMLQMLRDAAASGAVKKMNENEELVDEAKWEDDDKYAPRRSVSDASQ
jgi:hypothetical protein